MFKKTILKNGLRIITYPMENTRALTLLLLFGTGSKYETKQINGISHFIEHLAFKGTKKRPSTLDIAKELDRIGGIYNAFTGKEFMGFWIKVQTKHLDLASDVLSDMIFNSSFKEREIEKEKKVIFEEINMIRDNPQGYVLELWEKLLYGDQPAGWSIAGEKEILAKISRKHILDYLKGQFVAKNAIVVLAGKFNEAAATAKLKKFFQNFKENSPKPKKKTRESQKKPAVLLKFRESGQTHFCLGVRAFNIFSPKKYALGVLATILGGIMSSRLFIKVREKKGLAYYIRTLPEYSTDTGFLLTHVGADNKRIKEALKIILREYQNLREKKVSKEELSKAKDNLKGHLYLGLETSDSWAAYLGGQEVLKKKIEMPEKECKLVDKVTQNDILKVAKEIFQPEKLNLALIGPFKDKSKFEQLLHEWK